MTMNKVELSLRSSTYKNNILEGFTRLQQSDEFVDMTLAAEGHLIKIHKSIIALASPYLKELLQSVPSPHPVIFLNGVSHEELSFMVEYIYKGEVQVPAEKVHSFIKTAKAMHIVGLKNLNSPAENTFSSEENQTTHVFHKPEQPQPPIKDSTTINNETNFDLQMEEPINEIPDDATEIQTNYDLSFNIDKPTLLTMEPSTVEETIEIQNTNNNINSHGKSINVILNDCVTENNVGQKPVAKIEIISNTIINRNMNTLSMNTNEQVPLPLLNTQSMANINNQNLLISNKESTSSKNTSASSNQIDLSNLLNMGGKILLPQYTSSLDDVIMTDYMDCDNNAAESINANNTEGRSSARNFDEGTIVYTVSNRGAVQLILDEFMYYCHYQRDEGHKRRWRCIDYRDAHCKAMIDTVGEEIVTRKSTHCHADHGEKIRKKIKKSCGKIFSTIQKAEDILKGSQVPNIVIEDSNPSSPF